MMSGYFSGQLNSLDLSNMNLPEGYTFISFDEKDVPEKYRKQWEYLSGSYVVWDVIPENAHVLFLMKEEEVVYSIFFITDEKISTGMLHGGKCKEAYMRKGFYKYVCLRGLTIMKEKGLKVVDEHTGKSYLWPFWISIGCKEVEKLSHLVNEGRRK